MIQIDMKMPKSCKECPFGDHEAWCLVPGNWRERYYMPTDEVSECCPLKELNGKEKPTNIWETIDHTANGKCPNCKCDVNEYDNSMMCGRCGQLLEWEQ